MALTKVDDRGLKTPIDLLDNEKIRLGTGNDLELYHNGSHSYLTNSTGNLNIGTDGELGIYGGSDYSEFMAKFIDNGAVELFHDNVKRFETHSEGTYHYGHSTFIIGDEGESAQLFLHADDGDDNADKWKLVASAGGPFYLQNYTSGSWESNLIAYGNGAVELYHDNSKKLETNSTGVHVTGMVTCTTEFRCDDNEKFVAGTGQDLQIYHDAGAASHINATGLLNIDGTTGVRLEYNNATKLDITSTGVEITGKLTFANDNHLNGIELGADQDINLYHDGSNAYFDNGTGDFYIRNAGDNSNQVYIQGKGGEHGIIVNGDGAIDLYHDNLKKFATHGSGVAVHSEESVLKMYDESNGVNERKAIYAGLGNTATGTFTASNCHGGGTVTISGFNNGNGNISTTTMFPIQINSSGAATLGGSSIFSINGSAGGTSFTVAAANQGITVTNGGGAFCQFRVLFDITANI